jgi:hypothetical protein
LDHAGPDGPRDKQIIKQDYQSNIKKVWEKGGMFQRTNRKSFPKISILVKTKKTIK